MAKSKHIGLFFGSFNPVHTGHMIIANFMVEHSDLDQIWMVVSPQNPHKEKKSLASEYDRLHMVTLAIGDLAAIKASDVEFKLPKPSYTIDTLSHLSEKYPDHEFSLIMGGDNLGSFHKWKNYELILQRHRLFVYQRPSYEVGPLARHDKVTMLDAPLLQLSASYIRQQLRDGKSIKYLVPDPVLDELMVTNLYRS